MHKISFLAAAAFVLTSGSITAAETPSIGVVNFASCMTESKAGKKEQENMESIRKQMSSLAEDTERELREIAAKFEDPDYLDSLSPQAEEELKNKYQALQESLNSYQNQFYQVLNQVNYQMIQKMSGAISKAAATVASEQNLDYVLNKEVCFYINPSFDVTPQVIAQMDQSFEIEAQAAKKTADNDSVKETK
jgi:outer membrane protein